MNHHHHHHRHHHHFCIVLYCINLSISIALLTARAFQKRSRPQQLTLCWSLHAEAPQATVSEGLAQGPYTWRLDLGFEPTIRTHERRRLSRHYQCVTKPHHSNVLTSLSSSHHH